MRLTRMVTAVLVSLRCSEFCVLSCVSPAIAGRNLFIPQYKQLQELYWKYSERGFHILAFPCNQFGHQEPDTNDYIEKSCRLNYGTTFPMFAKIDVNGANAEPLFAYLKSAAPGFFGSQAIKWNFTKFLIDATGVPVKRYAPITSPRMIAKDIERELHI